MSRNVTSSFLYMIWKALEAARPPREALAVGRPDRPVPLPLDTDVSMWTGTFGDTRRPTRIWYSLKVNAFINVKNSIIDLLVCPFITQQPLEPQCMWWVRLISNSSKENKIFTSTNSPSRASYISVELQYVNKHHVSKKSLIDREFSKKKLITHSLSICVE